MERGLTKNQILSELVRSPHGDLKQYVPLGKQAAREEREFFAHLIAWNEKHGEIRDSRVALPVISLTEPGFNLELAENSYAHLALLDPRNFLRGMRFAKDLRPGNPFGSGRRYARLVERYLRVREDVPPRWDRAALAHRASMRELYALFHIKPAPRADRILFKGERPTGSVFEAVAQLRTMPAVAAAGTIMEHKIPFLVAMGALGARAKEEDLVLALIDRMSPAELVTNTKMLERLGIKTVPALRAAYEAGLLRAAEKGKGLKASKAAQAVGDKKLKSKLKGLQERQIAASAGIEGNWLVLGDKSGSMASAIEAARHVAGTLAKMVRGRVHLVFFNESPQAMEVTGKSYDEILAMTKRVTASGQTSIGCGLRWALDNHLEVDGIAIVSDGEENHPPIFVETYMKALAAWGKDVPVYLYHCGSQDGTLTRNMQRGGQDMQVLSLPRGLDYYSLPNLVATMRSNRYSLIDEVMATPLITLDQAFSRTS